MNKIQDTYNWFKKFDDKNILLKIENKNIEFKINEKSLPHLLGLQYIDKSNVNRTGSDLVNLIKYSNDDEIFYKLININNPKMLKNVKERINNFKEFMENLENAVLVEKTNQNTNIRSQHFLIETKDNKILHLGLLNAGYSDIPIEFEVIDKKYLETFILEKTNKQYKDTTIYSKVKSIYEYIDDELKYFSFDEEKQKKLNEVEKLISNYDYHKAINLSIDEIKKEINENKKMKTKSKSKQKGMER